MPPMPNDNGKGAHVTAVSSQTWNMVEPSEQTSCINQKCHPTENNYDLNKGKANMFSKVM